MPGRTIAIGDIHGCLDALNALLFAVSPESEDTLVFLGDYVDRGPDSMGVIERIIQLEKQCQVVGILGNHEEMMLAVTRDGQPHDEWLKHGGIDTLDSYGFSGSLDIFPPTHNSFFDTLVEFFETKDHIFVHAAYSPNLPLIEQPSYLLRWHSLYEGVPDPHFSGKKVIVGHTADQSGEIFNVGHLICIDTFCYGGGWLTALDVDSGFTWKANQQGQMAS